LKINREHIVGLVCIVIAVFVFMVTPGFPEGQDGVNLTGPAFFPEVMAGIYLCFGVYQLALGFLLNRKKAEGKEAAPPRMDKRAVQNTIVFLLLLAGFVAFFEPLGFIVTSLLFLFLFMVSMGVPALKSGIYSAVFVVVIYLLFGKLFTIGLPAGILAFLEL